MSKMKRNKKIKIINLTKLSAIVSHKLMSVALIILISHIILLTRKLKAKTTIRILALLSRCVLSRKNQCNLNASTIYTTKHVRLTARRTIYVSLIGLSILAC